jgi:hypothetical protein
MPPAAGKNRRAEPFFGLLYGSIKIVDPSIHPSNHTTITIVSTQIHKHEAYTAH